MCSEQHGAGQEKKLPFHVHLAQKSDPFTRQMLARCLYILRALFSMGKPKRLQGLHPLPVTKFSAWLQIPLQVEKRVQRSSVVNSHERKGRRSRNADPEIGAEVVQPVANLFLSRK